MIDGILQPASAIRFKATFHSGTVPHPLLSRQLVSIEYDIATKAGCAKLEMPAIGAGIERELHLFCDSNVSTIVVEILDGMGEVAHSVGFEQLRVKSCIVNHDYAGGTGQLFIELVFEYDTFLSTKVEKNEDGKVCEVECQQVNIPRRIT